MDTGALTTLVPAGGLTGVLALLVIYLLRQIPADRADFRETLAAERGRTAAAESRTAAALERAELAQMQVDEEREKRRAAEAVAAEAEAKLTAQQLTLRWYATERDRMLRYMPPEVAPGVIPDAPEREAGT